MSIPQTQKEHTDALDLLVDACKIIDTTQDLDGRLVQTLHLDPKKAWYKTQIVNSPTFARFVFELEEFERLSEEVKFYMTQNRAAVLAAQIKGIVKGWGYSIDAKSSESLRDKHNSQATLLDKMQKNKVEKAITLKDEAKKSMLEGWLGRETNEEQ